MSRVRTLAISACGLGVVYFAGTQMKDFKTPGVRNIERRHTAAGGADNHTPAIASKLGDETSVDGRQETQKGIGSKYFEETHGDQKPEASELGKKWNRTQYGHGSGKGSSVT